MGPVLVELAELDQRLQGATGHPLLGPASLHASLIVGGQEASSYPERCVVTGEWRTLPGDDVRGALQEAIKHSGVKADMRLTYQGDPFEAAPDTEIVQVLHRHAGTDLTGARYWADSALLAGSDIPTVLFGPEGGGAHAIVEWVTLSSVARVRDVLVATAREFCGESGT